MHRGSAHASHPAAPGLSLNLHEMLYYGFVAPWEKVALNNEQHLNELESFFMQHAKLEFLFILLSCIIK